MVVDLLRSCYTTQAQLLRGLPRRSPLTWYFVDGAKPLPYLSAVNSLNWMDVSERPASAGFTGEVPTARRPWYDGAPPTGFAGSYSSPWGTSEDFKAGGLLSLLPVQLGPDGLPSCCGPCAVTLNSPQTFVADVSGFVDGFYPVSVCNGVWQMPFTPALADCTWAGGDGLNVALEMSFLPTQVQVVVSYPWNADIAQWFYTAEVPFPWEAVPITLALVSGQVPGVGTAPDTILLLPSQSCDTTGPGWPITTDAGDPILTDAGDPIYSE